MKFVRVLGWAVFLAMSWTWCIGMYLPALLVRDFGIWAFVIFAIPNVVGAAAMAWVLPDAEASRELVRQHKTACLGFSLATIAFNSFFLGWITGTAGLVWVLIGGAVLILLMLVYGELPATAIVLIVSCAVATKLALSGAIPHVALAPNPVPVGDLLCLIPVCGFGFALCPYMDLTFHQARQANGRDGGRAAFALGFGVFFLFMILFTLAYSGWIINPQAFVLFTGLLPLVIYLATQTALKLVLHYTVFGRLTYRAIILAIVVAAISLGIWCNDHDAHTQLRRGNAGEQIYLCFLSFYGLVFPAYVWICIFGKRSRSIWLAAVLIAAPMYWMGFIERQMIWLLPGVAIVFAARFLPALMKPRIAT
jgi:hypothetical protein